MKKEKSNKLGRGILSIVLTVALVMGLVPGNVMTVAAEETEFVIDNLRYTILTEADGENLGTVSVTDYESSLTAAVTIPDSVTDPDSSTQYSVTSIGDRAFEFCSGLEGITIPDSVTSIGNSAFEFCSGLTSVEIGANSQLTSIGDRAFEFCSGLTSVTIPSSVTNIGNYAFYGCSGLTSVTIPDSVTSIGDRAFSGCSGLTSVTIPDSVTNIGDSAFSGCSGLTSVTIPSSVTSIGNSAFECCSGLESVTIPSSVTSIGNSAFCDCSALTSITIPDSVTSIGNYAFCDCSKLTSVEFGINSRLTSIGEAAFMKCIKLTSVTIPSSVTDIGDRPFIGCIGLTCVEFGANSRLASIGDYAFYGCSELESITIPDSVTSISADAFLECISLTEVNVPCTWNFETPLYDFGSVTPTVYHAGERFTAANNSITVVCSCGENRCTATINATGGTYNGSAYEAGVSYSDDWTGDELTIHYTKNGENSSTADAPSGVGSYTASITMGEGEDAVTASEVFEITAKELTVSEATATGRTYEKGNTSVAITGIDLSGIVSGDDVSVSSNGLSGTLSGANAGDYTEVTLSESAEFKLSGADKDNYVLKQPSKAVPTTVTISPLEKGPAQNVTKNYPFPQEKADTVNLGSLLPEDCGTVVSYGTPDVSGDITYKAAPSIKEGTLAYTVAKGSEEIVGKKGTITVHVQTQNYTDVPVTISIMRVECTHTGETEVKNEKEATYNEEGYTGDTHCKDCGAKLATGTKIAKKEAPKVGDKIKSADGSATYKVIKAGEKGGEVAFAAPTNKKKATVVIPATVTINNITYKVTGIADGAFKGNKKLKKVTIGKNVKTIGKSAFYGCKKLSKLTIKSTKLTTKKIGSKAFSKTPKSMKVTVPKKKFKTYKSMLIKKGVNKKAKFKKG